MQKEPFLVGLNSLDVSCISLSDGWMGLEGSLCPYLAFSLIQSAEEKCWLRSRSFAVKSRNVDHENDCTGHQLDGLTKGAAFQTILPLTTSEQRKNVVLGGCIFGIRVLAN